ncbi:optic atrophy 3 protein-domain-containing protein [Kockovaella imperatae]|uniref:Optic atrophy 3 protein-domain-containing protein n=1 Tax=Kockovaella imperatae TaxID=4999 RepID=A0A1Y1U5D9_9TREE|nr:optic atrophy 3 protein-domain-containing protein [Kockovaella imperatae]ORX33243.1 optic atrophy 3 protein-domain-containing protein [Kockovaella imperatae]
MASVKIFSLVVRTLAKPIANTIKAQASEHESFRRLCIGLAQRMHRTEARLRMGLLNESAQNIKPLNDTRAIQNGATTLAESFLFLVGAGLVVGESWRSSRKEGKRRDDVSDRLERLEADLGSIKGLIEDDGKWSKTLDDMRERNENIQRILETVVSNGLKAGWMSLGHQDGIGDVLPLMTVQRGSEQALPGPDGMSALRISTPWQATDEGGTTGLGDNSSRHDSSISPGSSVGISVSDGRIAASSSLDGSQANER